LNQSLSLSTSSFFGRREVWNKGPDIEVKPERPTFIRNVRESRGPIYLALHGETEWNQQRRFQGRLDSPLTEIGLNQARRAGVTLLRLLGNSAEFHIVTSPLARARETARLICRTLNVGFARVEIDSRLAEIDLGSWAGLTREEVEKHWADLVRDAGRYNWYFRSPDGERFEDLANRLGAFLASAKDFNGVTIAVTHGVASRALRGVYSGLPREKAITLENNRNVLFRLCDGVVDSVPYD
jgi:broad specificity phosphatase PhoE